jgi:hypothetical protein
MPPQNRKPKDVFTVEHQPSNFKQDQQLRRLPHQKIKLQNRAKAAHETTLARRRPTFNLLNNGQQQRPKKKF